MKLLEQPPVLKILKYFDFYRRNVLFPIHPLAHFENWWNSTQMLTWIAVWICLKERKPHPQGRNELERLQWGLRRKQLDWCRRVVAKLEAMKPSFPDQMWIKQSAYDGGKWCFKIALLWLSNMKCKSKDRDIARIEDQALCVRCWGRTLWLSNSQGPQESKRRRGETPESHFKYET